MQWYQYVHRHHYQMGCNLILSGNEVDAVEVIEDIPNHSGTPSLKIKNRRLSVSLPKDIDRFQSIGAGRKLGTVAKPYQAEMFVEQNINELCPMMEKYRQ